VSEAWKDRLWGNVILVEHDDGYQSTYAGLNTLNMVAEGDAVGMGQVIGSVGQSASCEAERGWHLHFELTRDGEPVDFKTLVP
jgi:murein DD-endopeptidase MepM/ murein hydrolase activator NlpD